MILTNDSLADQVFHRLEYHLVVRFQYDDNKVY